LVVSVMESGDNGVFPGPRRELLSERDGARASPGELRAEEESLLIVRRGKDERKGWTCSRGRGEVEEYAASRSEAEVWERKGKEARRERS
jgi:hypothetical protein